MISSRSSSLYAFATVLLLSSRSLASWRMEGSESPGFRTPAVTAALICSMSCSNCGSGLSMSMVISIGAGAYMYQLNPWYNWLIRFATPTNRLAGFRVRKQGTARRRRRFLAGDDARAILFQVVGDGLDADLHRARGLGGVEILEREKKCSRSLHDLLHRRVGRLIHAAFITRQAHHAGNPRHPRSELGRPQDLVGVGAVRGRPDVGDVER